jgi:hypothetical protein
MNTYRVRIQQDFRDFSHPWGVAPLDGESIRQSLKGATIRELSSDGFGTYTLDIALQRPEHVEAMNEILEVLQVSGYTVVNGVATQWASSVVEGAFVGVMGGGLLGTTADNGWGALILAVIGAVSGSVVGSTMKKMEKVYQFQPTLFGEWRITEVPLESTQRSARPGMAGA